MSKLMKKYEDREIKVVTIRECVSVVCDMCGRIAENPKLEEMPFEWGGVGSSYGELRTARSIDGEYDSETVDLCYECAEWLIEQIKSNSLRTKD